MKAIISLTAALLSVLGYSILTSPSAAEYEGYSFEPEVVQKYAKESPPSTEVRKKLPALEVHTGAWSADKSHDLLAFTYDDIILSIYKDENDIEHYGAGYVLRYDYSVFEFGAELGCNTDTDFSSTKCHIRPAITYTEYMLQPSLGYAHGSFVFSLRWRLHNGTN